MKKFLLDILFVFIVFLILWSCVEVALTQRENNYTYKNNFIEKNRDSITILLTGNSYFENSIDPYVFGKGAFDFATSGRWIYYDYILMKKHIPQMKNLQVLIFPLGYRFPFEISYHYRELRPVDKYYIYWHSHAMNVDYDRFPTNYLYQSSLLVGNVYMKDSVYCDSIGYHKFTGHNENFKIDQNIDPDIIYSKNVSKIFKEYFVYLEGIAKICYENDVRFIVVTTPCHDSFVENTRDFAIDSIHKKIEDINNRYPIEYKDYLKDGDFRADSLYLNCSHLNSIGATMLAEKIRKEFNLP